VDDSWRPLHRETLQHVACITSAVIILMMQAVRSSEKSVGLYHTTWRNIPECVLSSCTAAVITWTLSNCLRFNQVKNHAVFWTGARNNKHILYKNIRFEMWSSSECYKWIQDVNSLAGFCADTNSHENLCRVHQALGKNTGWKCLGTERGVDSVGLE
jgi:hypothetical protein